MVPAFLRAFLRELHGSSLPVTMRRAIESHFTNLEEIRRTWRDNFAQRLLLRYQILKVREDEASAIEEFRAYCNNIVN